MFYNSLQRTTHFSTTCYSFTVLHYIVFQPLLPPPLILNIGYWITDEKILVEGVRRVAANAAEKKCLMQTEEVAIVRKRITAILVNKCSEHFKKGRFPYQELHYLYYTSMLYIYIKVYWWKRVKAHLQKNPPFQTSSAQF